jgi:hypothetical protein
MTDTLRDNGCGSSAAVHLRSCSITRLKVKGTGFSPYISANKWLG